MKLTANTYIKNANIRCNDGITFEATYKGCFIHVSSDHGFGESIYPHLTRYYMTVTSTDGGYLVDTWDDFHTIHKAILYALRGAMLINE